MKTWGGRWFGALVVACAAALASCSTTPGAGSSSTTGPQYAQPGPYEVGVMTLKLTDRAVEVYYPAKKGSTEGRPRATYQQTDPLPPPLLARLPKLPEGVDLTITVPAVREVAAAKGPFPLVVFSHGAGAWRTIYGNPLAGLASWGFVVASTDYTEYGFIAQLTGAAGRDQASRRPAIAKAASDTIDLMLAQNRDPASRLNGVINPAKIGAVGHSAGGGTVFGLLNDPRIAVIVGWAPVPPQTPVTSHTPTMIIGGVKDIAVTPKAATAAYDSLLAPKRLIEVGNMGHNAFSDLCLAIRGGNDLTGLAKQMGVNLPEFLLSLARNGCQPGDLDTKTGWTIIQHFTVAELRSGLGVDRKPVGLEPEIAKAFPGVDIEYRQDVK